jgi:hypothetical protein
MSVEIYFFIFNIFFLNKQIFKCNHIYNSEYKNKLYFNCGHNDLDSTVVVWTLRTIKQKSILFIAGIPLLLG